MTELVTGVDIVKEQIRIAAGEPMTHTPGRDRACAATPSSSASTPRTRPTTSARTRARSRVFNPPGGFGVRIDSHVYSGYVVPPNYDSLLAQAHRVGRDREEAIARARRALDEFIVVGIPTTIPFHRRWSTPAFMRGEVYTDFIEDHLG